MHESQAPATPSAAHPVQIAPHGPEGVGLTKWETMDPATLAAGDPVQRGHYYDENEALGYTVGVWDCTAFDDQPGHYGVDEYMFLLEGEVVIAMPDGSEITIRPGEAFVIPKGLQCQWKMAGYVRKIFMILDRPEVDNAANASLARLTKPPMSALAASGADAVSLTHTAFVNADGRMVVTRSDFPSEVTGPTPSLANRLVTVLAGSVEIDGARFGSGETFYLRAGAAPIWRISGGTQVIEAAFSAGA